MIVWVVTGDKGEYSSREWWVIGVATDLAEAERLAIADKPNATFKTGPIEIPTEIVPGQTQVYLGESPGGYWDETYYNAEAFEVKDSE